ncbi:MAG TPA: contractile injection system protein, VgrG/Pvc8 family [Longimicrobium sp.]|nr:contractile injection system protein, VgrG/Pvc8 family [Longimicrobium sp.]
MSAQSIAALGTDFYVPAYEIRVGGRPIDRQAVRDVLSVTYTDSLESVDSFSLEVNNWDEEKRTTKYSEGDLFTPGQRVEVKLGYLDAGLVKVLTGEITSLQPKFPAEGPPTLTVSGLSLLHRLRRKERQQVYENKTDSQIAKQIAGDLGVDIETRPAAAEPVHPYVIQPNQQDIVFLLQRARQIGYELTVREKDDGTPALFFGTPDSASTLPFRLQWGASLLSFDPKLTTANQVGSVTVRAWHPTRKKVIEATVTRKELGGREPFTDAFNERQEIIADRPVSSEADAKRLATETLRNIAHAYVTASGSTVGLPRLRTGVRVEITGLGAKYLDGTYFVTGTTHTLGDSGYSTSFQARREVAQ